MQIFILVVYSMREGKSNDCFLIDVDRWEARCYNNPGVAFKNEQK